MSQCPKYLAEYKDLWDVDHKKAELEWFKNAKYGMFIHYGLYSLLHRHEWVMFQDKVPLNEYEKMVDHFTAHNFDADYITDLALESGMKYICMTACHHESFCLWDSKVEPYNSVHSPAGRDLIAEMSEACDRKGLGFFAYYTFMLNWRHPYYVDRSVFRNARPDYDFEEPRYLYRKKEDFKHYIDYIQAAMDELLSNYKITGIWLDLISAWYAMGEEYIPIEDIYAKIRRDHPDALISWKDGATGTEDYASLENCFYELDEGIREDYGDAGYERARIGLEGNMHKHNEICSTIQRGSWGFNPLCENRGVDELYSLLGHSIQHNCNLLLNVGPMGDGSINPQQAKILRQLGEKIRKEGYPVEGHGESIDAQTNN